MFRETDEMREPIWKGIVIKALFLGVFVVLLLWLFPMPKVEPLLDNLFNENIQTMKEAAKNYYTNERLPKEVGSKVSMTLSEMLTKKLLLPFVDGNGEQCDLNASYVEITKMETEYILKVYLSCNSRTDYIIEHLGCHDLCQKEECDCSCETAVVEEPKKDKPVKKVKTTTITEYQVQKTFKAGEWGDWSDWSLTYKEENNDTKREHRVVYTAKRWVETTRTQYEYKTVTVTTTTTQGSWTAWVAGDWTTAEYGNSDTRRLIETRVIAQPTGEYTCGSFYTTNIVALGAQSSYSTSKYCVKNAGVVSCSSGLCTKYNIYKKDKAVTKDVTQYRYETRSWIPGTTSSSTATKLEWTENNALFVGTRTEGNKQITTSYTGNTKQVSNNDGHYEAQQPVKYYLSVSDIPSGWVKDKDINQYRYKYRTYTTSTKTKWISKDELDSHLKDGWEIINTRKKTITL